MSETTAIEWCDHTWSPWQGCTKVSVGPQGGCVNCYADARDQRFHGGKHWGPGAPRHRTVDWTKPRLWNQKAAQAGIRESIFPSLCDPFDNEVDPAWRRDFFALIRATKWLDWLLLTKRIGNVEAMAAEAGGWPENAKLGISVCNQEEADRDILKAIRAKLALSISCLFLSVEPLLGPLTLRWLRAWPENEPTTAEKPGGLTNHLDGLRRIDWVIAGGESGHHARPPHPDWFRALRDECEIAGIPYMFKQWGEWLPINQQSEEFTDRLYRPRRVAKLHEDQAAIDDSYGRDCKVESIAVHLDGSAHELAEPMAFLVGTGAMQTFKVGKKAAGRLLDGVEHNGFPALMPGQSDSLLDMPGASSKP